MLIPCPYCGARDEREFVCGGEAHVDRPGPPETVSDEAWATYLFYRRNPRSVTFERWCHRYGCSTWFNVSRDVISHEIKAVYPMGTPRPEVE